MKKIFLFCLIVFALQLSSCNLKVEAPVASEISIDTNQIGESSDWMNINQNTKINISNVAEDEVFVMYINNSSKNIGEISPRAVSSSMIGGFNATKTGKKIIRTEDGVASFSGLDAGVTGTTTFKIERLKVQKVETLDDFMNTDLGVFDYNGKANGKIYIPNSKCGNYYVDEKVLSFNVNQILNQLKDIPGFNENSAKVVITRNFRYYDSSKAENNGENFDHNTRSTYGFLIKEKGEYKVVSEGVFNLNDIGNRVNLYAGFASNVIMGSGMSLKILPVTTLSLNIEKNVVTKNAVFGFENLEKDKYVLCLNNLGSNSIGDFSLQDTVTEIKRYDGSSLPNGLMLSYNNKSEKYYYFLGELSGNVYVNNMARNENVNNNGGTYYTAKLIKYDDIPDEIKNSSIYEYKDVIRIGVLNSLSSNNLESGAWENILLSGGEKYNSGNISFIMTNVPPGKKCSVQFKKYVDGSWKTVYDSSKYSCIIGNTSTGNKLLEFNLDTTNGNCNVSFRFNGLDTNDNIVAEIKFSDR
ncbi:MAG: hypothetical protein PUC01_01520 [Spirochaetales bacterium]|nr:hypothetical protein [Spirochaetales bacterium]